MKNAITRALSVTAVVAACVLGLMTPASSRAACIRTAADGQCGPYSYAGITGSNGSNTYVRQNVWNAIPGWHQMLTSRSPGNWSVSARMPRGNTAVVSYPDVQQLYTTTSNTPRPVSSFSRIVPRFTTHGPGSGNGNDYEWAFDIWAGTGHDNYAQEIMIWIDTHSQVPAGTRKADVMIMGQRYQLWADSGNDPVSLVLPRNRPSGEIHLLGDLRWLLAHGYMPRGSGLNSIEFGAELCSTGGVTRTFAATGYRIAG